MRSTERGAGMRYGGSSSSSGGVLPRNSVRPSTAAATSASTVLKTYMPTISRAWTDRKPATVPPGSDGAGNSAAMIRV
jgi:hypothetical protein